MSAETTIDACRFRVSNEPPRAVKATATRSTHSGLRMWRHCSLAVGGYRGHAQRRSGRGDDYVKSGNRRCAELLAHELATRRAPHRCSVLSRVRVRGTHIAHWDVWPLSMPRVCSVAPFFTFTARLLLTSKTLSLTGHSVDTFSVAPRSAHTFDVWPLRPSPLP